MNSFEDKNGNKRVSVQVVAEKVTFLSNNRKLATQS